jgi:17beta-estradiol 17-dehydrogenase / very-long-chain 3-oxoacyl-CoA reductase
LARECRTIGQAVDVVAVLPVEVATEATASTVPRGTPNSREFGKAMMNYAPRAAAKGVLELCPYWPHAVQMAVMEMLPECAFSRFVVGAFRQKMAVLKAGKRK